MPDEGVLRIKVRAHWVNRGVLNVFAKPYVRIDGREYAFAWGRGQELSVDAGSHTVETFIRYRGVRAELGTGRLEVTVAPGQHVHVESTNGITNGTPFTPRIIR